MYSHSYAVEVTETAASCDLPVWPCRGRRKIKHKVDLRLLTWQVDNLTTASRELPGRGVTPCCCCCCCCCTAVTEWVDCDAGRQHVSHCVLISLQFFRCEWVLAGWLAVPCDRPADNILRPPTQLPPPSHYYNAPPAMRIIMLAALHYIPTTLFTCTVTLADRNCRMIFSWAKVSLEHKRQF